MEQKVSQIKVAVREILGDLPSQMFLCRIDKTLDDAATDNQSLSAACKKIESMVKLFIGIEEARDLNKRAGEILQ